MVSVTVMLVNSKYDPLGSHSNSALNCRSRGNPVMGLRGQENGSALFALMGAHVINTPLEVRFLGSNGVSSYSAPASISQSPVQQIGRPWSSVQSGVVQVGFGVHCCVMLPNVK